MSIVDLQRSIREAGRIRIGEKVSGGRPSKLETFRLTSADRLRIEQAAAAFGGKVTEWEAPAGKQWQVTTERDSLDVIVPPSDLSFSQAYELWSAGGCQRRCDGVTEQLTQGPCRCDPENRECTPHTRLSVLLPDLPGLGVWRLDTQGWYAARELASVVELLIAAAGRGALLPARLRLEQRSTKKQAKGKTQTLRYAVPVLDVEVSPAALLNASAPAMGLEQATGFTPLPQLESAPSIAEQSAPPEPKAPRANGAVEIPPSGIQRAAIEQPAVEGTLDAPAGGQETADTPAPAPSTTPEAGGTPPVAAPPAPRDPVDVMLELVRAAGKDPDALLAAVNAIRAQNGEGPYGSWSEVSAEDIATLTAKAQAALEARVEEVAGAPLEPAGAAPTQES
ncbi:MAG: hypothetical protein IT341_10465 [Chloroflexi bacterium]|nr:hypothetical protein [Chloroflexota bacterium]